VQSSEIPREYVCTECKTQSMHHLLLEWYNCVLMDSCFITGKWRRKRAYHGAYKIT